MNATTTIRIGSNLLADVKADNNLPEPNRESAPASLYTIEGIHIRAEMMTPLLKRILDFHPPVHKGVSPNCFKRSVPGIDTNREEGWTGTSPVAKLKTAPGELHEFKLE
jgi:hypothetical protein